MDREDESIVEALVGRGALPPAATPCVYFAYQSEQGKRRAFRLAESLRDAGISADLAFGDRKLGKQLSAADRAGAQLAVILGEDELANQTVTLKDLRTGEQRSIPQDSLVNELGADRGETV